MTASKSIRSSSSPPNSVVLKSGKSITYESRGPTAPQPAQSTNPNPAILFVHGLGVSSLGAFPLIEASGITKTHRVITFDADGHGRTPLSKPFDPTDETARKDTQLEFYVQDIIDFLGALGILQPVILAAHSMGGLVALKFASTYPGLVHKLFLLAPATATAPYTIPAYISRAQTVYKENSVESLLPMLVASSVSPKTLKSHTLGPFVTSIIRAAYLATHPQGFARDSIARANAVTPVPFSKITAPTLIIVGNDDKITPKNKDGEYIKKGVKGAQLKIVKGSGHWPHLEALEETSKLFAAFVTSPSGVAASHKL